MKTFEEVSFQKKVFIFLMSTYYKMSTHLDYYFMLMRSTCKEMIKIQITSVLA